MLAFVILVIWIERRFELSQAIDPARVEAWVHRAGVAAPLIFMLTMAAAIVVSPIPSLPLDVLAGTLFGPVLGTLYAAVGATLGAVASFHIARLLGREVLARFLGGHINFCRRCSDRLLTHVVLVSRLIPFVSFDVVSYGAGLTAMSTWRFALVTFIGMLPLTFFYVSAGSAVLGNRLLAIAGGLLMVALFFLLPRWIERYDPFSMRRHFGHGGDAEPE
ncbi:MAG: TVP38/TMEM64 family protein [Thermoanaerobaculia bacterium]